jgi:hypothetical protein
MKVFSLFFILFWSLSGFSKPLVKCTISAGPAASGVSEFADFDGGTYTVDLENRNAWVESKVGMPSGKKTMTLVDRDFVSSFKAERNSCRSTGAVSQDDNNEMKAFEFNFENCSVKNHQTPTSQAILTVLSGYDFKTMRGVYMEIFSDGPAKSTPNFALENCKVYSDAETWVR